MSDNDKEDDATEEEIAEDVEPVPQPEQEEVDFDEIEEQLEQMHDSLDAIKETGRNLSEYIQENVPEDAEQEEVMEAQRLLTKANLLTRRVEQGDRNVVRGG